MFATRRTRFAMQYERQRQLLGSAAMESGNHSLNVEAIHGERFATRGHAKAHVFDHIEIYYYRQRLHSRLGYVPMAFELSRAA